MKAIILIIIIIIAMLIFIKAVYGQEDRFAGCALSLCPQGIVDYHFKNGGQEYYGRLPQGSKERMNAYFNQVDEEFRH